MRVTEKAPAKINLILRVFEKRADGFHRIETVMQKLSLCDDLSIEVGEGEGITVETEGHPELSGENNIGFKAARAYLEKAGLRKKVSIRVTKRVFVAAGLGGGSSDAAAVLRGLQKMFEAISFSDLVKIAADLGSDVPFFLHSCDLAAAAGRGEEIHPWPSLPPRPVLLANPGFPVSTAEAYRALGRPLTWKEADGTSFALAPGPKKWSDLEGLLRPRNDLQDVVERMHPEIGLIRRQLAAEGAATAQMSGSGGTVFGLFEDEKTAASAERRLRNRWKTALTKTGAVE